MNEENHEYEYEAVPEKANDSPLAMPEGVIERMQKHAERTGDKLPDVISTSSLSLRASTHAKIGWKRMRTYSSTGQSNVSSS